MSGILKKSLLAVCFVFISTAVVFAATYWLPDYEGYSSLGDKKPGPNLPGGDDDGGDKRQKTCEDFNMHSIGNVPKGTTCKTAYPGFGLRCYSNCRCTAEYTYTSQTQTDLFCSGSCTDDNGETKYKCTSCCPSGYDFEPYDMQRPQVVGWTRCGGLKDESTAPLSLSCKGSCYRCVDVCGSGKKYCSDTDSCAPSNGCCSDSDCGGGKYGIVAVGSEGKTRCDMSTHTCTYPLCEDGYTETKPACPNGKTLCQQEGNPGCWGCCGVECNANYSTATTAESCKDGQTFETQGDNELCGICKGTACASGYTTEVKNCPAPNLLESDANNALCTRCLSCEDQGMKACGGKCIAATACCTNGVEGCGDGQKCDGTGVCVAKTCEEQGLKTCGTTCIATTACCSNGTEGCGNGQKCDGTGVCVAKTCEEQGLKECNGTCIAADGCCSSSECGTGYACTNNTCTEIPCEDGYTKIEGLIAGVCNHSKGLTEVYQKTNPNCYKCEEIPCEAGYEKNNSGALIHVVCNANQTKVYQDTNPNCAKCVDKSCEEQGKKACGNTCIAKDSCCTNGTEGCLAGEECLCLYTTIDGDPTCACGSKIPGIGDGCAAGYSKDTVCAERLEITLTQSDNPECKKCSTECGGDYPYVCSGSDGYVCQQLANHYCCDKPRTGQKSKCYIKSLEPVTNPCQNGYLCTETVTYVCGSTPRVSKYKLCATAVSEAGDASICLDGDTRTETRNYCCPQPCSSL